jgi:SAM-dependent methyltransferase
MQVLMSSVFHLAGLRAERGAARAAIAIDAQTGIRADAYAQVVRPWRSWLELTGVIVTDEAPAEWWYDVAAERGAAVAVVSDRPEFQSLVQEAAAARGLRYVRCDLVTESEREKAFLQEMSHHHFEFGGLDEWNGTNAKHSPAVLQHLSAANCITHFPRHMIDPLRDRHAALGRTLDSIDIGSGAVSRLRWGALQGWLHVTGVDPLQDVYDVVLAHHGLDALPSIRVDRALPVNAEELDRHVPPASFDFAYCCNALDHVEDPPAVIAQVARALRPGAWFALEFSTREGTRQQWEQLHQFDLYVDPDRRELMCQRRDGSVGPLLPEGVGLRLENVVVANDLSTVVVLVREPTGNRPRFPRAVRLGLRSS